MNPYIAIKNNQSIPVDSIPSTSYAEFIQCNLNLLNAHPERHCVNYFGYKEGERLQLVCCIADDATSDIYISSCIVTQMQSGDLSVNASGTIEGLESMTAVNHNYERFEREIHENFGVPYRNHPWLKPVRYPYNRADKNNRIENYPFFKSSEEELHEVGVGPIHAGIIEPGHFRFICNGEQIMHLEIQLGFQHRGIEELFLKKTNLTARTILAESIAGDTTVGHTTAFANLWEGLCGIPSDHVLDWQRTMALELERIAIHTGDLAAICTDIAYQLGNAVYGRLRTPIVNFFQEWCGNRFAKGLIRVGRSNYTFNAELAHRLLVILGDFQRDFEEITSKVTNLPSALSRLEKTGVVTHDQVLEIGTVGMSARMSGLMRDIRWSHPTNLYGKVIRHQPVIKHHGDVYSRFQIRKEEVRQSIGYLKELLNDIPEFKHYAGMMNQPAPAAFTISLVEGWRGEICHCAVTNAEGELIAYKIKDPSFHNWMALAQAVRNNEISDFPICNKSFNLSYCGHDL